MELHERNIRYEFDTTYKIYVTKWIINFGYFRRENR